MAKSRPTVTKRLREKAKQDKLMRKADRKAEREGTDPDAPEVPDDVDPDIAHIKPGPQAPIWLEFE